MCHGERSVLPYIFQTIWLFWSNILRPPIFYDNHCEVCGFFSNKYAWNTINFTDTKIKKKIDDADFFKPQPHWAFLIMLILRFLGEL